MAAEKVDKTPAGALPLFMSEKKKKKQAWRAAALDLLPAIRDVIEWTLLNTGIVACSLAFGTAYALIITSISQPPSWLLLLRPVKAMTDKERDVAGTLEMLWGVCAAAQAMAGALALALPGHRRRLRLPLAYAALVATAAGHCVYVGLHCVIVAVEPVVLAGVNTAAIFVFGMGDLLCFLGLIVRGGEE